MRHDRLFAASRARRLLEEYNLTGSVLVIGCAEGYLVEALVRLKVDAYGLDRDCFVLSLANGAIKNRLVIGSATEIVSYNQVCDLANVTMFSCIISENIFYYLTDQEAEAFHTLSVFFGERVIHLIKRKVGLKEPTARSITQLRRIFNHSNVTFKIQA